MILLIRDVAQLWTVLEKTIPHRANQGVVSGYRAHVEFRFKRAEPMECATSHHMGLAPDAFSEPVIALLKAGQHS